MFLILKLLIWSSWSSFILSHQAENDESRKFTMLSIERGPFRCLGTLISPKDIITCCSCVSDVRFVSFYPLGQSDANPVVNAEKSYEVFAVHPANLTVTTMERIPISANEVIIHSLCDIDGAYDYGIVRFSFQSTKVSAREKMGGSFPKIWERQFVGPEPATIYSMVRSDIVHRIKNVRMECMLHTTKENGDVLLVPVRFTERRFCWNLTEDLSPNANKHCMVSMDGTYIADAKCGSPIFCESKLVGMASRRFPLGGYEFGAVNGMEGAISFIQELTKLRMSSDNEHEDGYIRTSMKQILVPKNDHYRFRQPDNKRDCY